MRNLASNHRLLNRNGVWYYRRRVPQNLRTFFDLEMVMVSLKTSDRKEAASLRTIRDLEWDAKFAAAEARLAEPPLGNGNTATDVPTVLSGPAALQMVLSYVERTDRQRSEKWAADPPTNAHERREAKENLEIDLAAVQGLAPAYDHVEYLSQAWARIFGPNAVVGDAAENAAVLDLVKRACIEIQRRAMARAEDDHSRRFFDAQFDPSRPKPVTVRELAEEFIALKAEEAQALGTSAKHLERQHGNMSLIRDILRDETLVSDINWNVCRRFVSVLAQVPSNRTKKYKDHTLEEAIEHAAMDGNPALGFISQQQYLGTLKEFLELAVKKDLIRTNYASDLRPMKVDAVAPEDKTIPFDVGQLRSFFRSSYYMGCAGAGGDPYRNAGKPWRFWFPLLSLFCGMRPREIFQLHIADLKTTDKGTLYFDLAKTSDADDVAEPENKKTLKTPTSRRQVPVHPELVKIGFAKFVAELMTASDDELIFRGITRDKYGDPAHYPLRDFRDTFLPKGMALRPRQTAYSFRHTWRDAARAIGASPDFLKAVGAWKGPQTTSDIYGSKHHPDLYASDLARIEYPGLNLKHLYLESNGSEAS